MTDEEFMTALGDLARDARVAKGATAKSAGPEAGIAPKTLRAFENAYYSRLPNSATANAVEAYCGWRRGAIRDLWNKRRDLVELTPDMLEIAKPTGLIKASHLSDQELMAELNFRFLMRDSRNGGE